MSKYTEEALTAAGLKKLESLQTALRRQWSYMRTMISSDSMEILEGSGNLVSATGYAVCNALVRSSRYIQEITTFLDQGREEGEALSTTPEEVNTVTKDKGTHGACGGAKPIVEAMVTAKLAELEAMECKAQREQAVQEWTQQEIQIELASVKLRKVFSSHNNGIQSMVSETSCSTRLTRSASTSRTFAARSAADGFEKSISRHDHGVGRQKNCNGRSRGQSWYK